MESFEETNNQGIHIHCPEGATPKDGPSAGTAITVALYSLMNNKPIRYDLAITGEINLQGNVTAIGGLDLKIIGGINNGVKTFLYPKDNQKDFDKFLYNPTISLVNHVKNLGVPVICFPRGINDYIKFAKIVKPSMINIDYNVDPENLIKSLDLPVQGGLDPKILLSDKENLRKQTKRYLNIFKDHPYVFNLGHGILPETEVEMVYELVETVRNYK